MLFRSTPASDQPLSQPFPSLLAHPQPHHHHNSHHHTSEASDANEASYANAGSHGHMDFKSYVARIIWEADSDSQALPPDSYHVWSVEGAGSSVGSLSSLGSAISHGNAAEAEAGPSHDRLSLWVSLSLLSLPPSPLSLSLPLLSPSL